MEGKRAEGWVEGTTYSNTVDLEFSLFSWFAQTTKIKKTRNNIFYNG